jgi:hypothetical protein
MPNICTGGHYDCGATGTWKTGVSSEGALSQGRNRKTSFMLGATEIIVNQEVRNFIIAYSGGWSASPAFLMYNDEGGLFACGTPDYSATTPHSVSESYDCTNTVLYFLDMRYNNAIGKEVVETIAFNEASDAVAGFKETWGIFYYPKFVITNHVLTTTTNYFIVLGGVKTVLKTTTATSTVNGPGNPLILVWPNPPSLAIPWVNIDDIVLYGFYDYHAVGDEEGQVKIRRDGGDDFFLTDWMRNMGAPALNINQTDAENRYFDFYLGAGVSGTSSYPNPGIFTDSTPVGSIAQDKDGNVFYSVELGGEIFNSLTGGSLPELFPTLGPNQKFFPVGLV